MGYAGRRRSPSRFLMTAGRGKSAALSFAAREAGRSPPRTVLRGLSSSGLRGGPRVPLYAQRRQSVAVVVWAKRSTGAPIRPRDAEIASKPLGAFLEACRELAGHPSRPHATGPAVHQRPGSLCQLDPGRQSGIRLARPGAWMVQRIVVMVHRTRLSIWGTLPSPDFRSKPLVRP